GQYRHRDRTKAAIAKQGNTKDGWLVIMCNKEKFWTGLTEAVGKPEWATDPEYSRFAARLKNREQVTLELDAVLTTATTAEWISRLGGKVPIAPVYSVQQALENPFVAEQQLVLDFQHPKHGKIRGVVSPVLNRSGAESTRFLRLSSVGESNLWVPKLDRSCAPWKASRPVRARARRRVL